jgi:hypothetical protein
MLLVGLSVSANRFLPVEDKSGVGDFTLIRSIDTEPGIIPGRAIDGLGDISGDGLGDIIAGASYADPGGVQKAGSVFIYSGGNGALLQQLDGESAESYFGRSVNGPGDLNGDGVPDFVVSAPHKYPLGGEVVAFSGADFSEIYTVEGGSSSYGYGSAVGDAPDADGDGVRELLVSHLATTAGYPGFVDVLSGSDGHLIRSLGPVPNYGMMTVINGSSAGYFDGDDVADWAVYFGTTTVEMCGAVGTLVFSGDTGEVIFASQLDGDHCSLGGGNVLPAGDLNADGYDDVWVVSEAFDCGGALALGGVRVYLGPTGSLLYEACGDSAYGAYGDSAAPVEDLDCDGIGELLVSAPWTSAPGPTHGGAIYLVRGSDGERIDQALGQSADERLGWAIGTVGDVDGNGLSDIAALSLEGGQSSAIRLYRVQSGLNRCYLTRVAHRQGFDIGSAPSAEDLEAWWNAPSPYKYLGIYFGGINRSDAKQLKLNEEGWLTRVASAGWQFIPIWAGPTVPCRAPIVHFSQDPVLAEEDGRVQAHLAVDEAYRLGLVGPTKNGTVIYYDVEPFDPEGNEPCTTALNAFVSGWVDELHLLGNTAGVYAHQKNVMALADGPDDPYPGEPDAIWIAGQYYQELEWNEQDRKWEGHFHYDPLASVWGIPQVPDTAWNDHNRLRQYAGDHEETHGGTTFWEIDSNVGDGKVAVLPGVIPSADQRSFVYVPRAGSPSAGGRGPIHAMDLLTAEEGWVWAGRDILWTHTGGSTWEDITPGMLDDDAIMAVEFPDSANGFVMSAQASPVDETVQMRLSRTTDGGKSWTTGPFLSSDQTGYPATCFMDFVDPFAGWVVVKQQTSSNSSEGLLFSTLDGGESWIPLTIPSGNPVRFVTPLDGWTLGGPGRDALYQSNDGGTSWQLRFLFPGFDWRYDIYDLPTFTSPQDGILPMIATEVDQTEVWFFVTHNGGSTWVPDAIEYVDRYVGPNNVFPIEAIDLENVILPTQGGLPGQEGAVTALSFISPDVGWATSNEGGCTEVGEVITCNPLSSLLATSDGGDTWQEISLPLPSLYLPIIMR